MKKHRLSLDKDKKILTLSKKLYSENCSREDLLAKTSSIKIDSDNNNINERSFKNVESNDNETDVDLPTLKRPRRRFLNSSENRLTHTHYSIIPDSGENTEFEDKECGNNYSTCLSTIHSKTRIKLEREKGVDIPRLDDFQNNLKIRETNKNVSVASNIVNVKHESKNNNKSVYKHYGTTPGVEQTFNQLDKNSGISRHFNLLDTEADIGRFDKNDFSDGNDSISSSCNENHYETNASNINKAEQKISGESKCEQISVENTSLKDLSDSFSVSSKDPAKTYPITLPPTQPIIIDRISEDKFKDKIFKADTKKEQLQALGIKKKKCNATNNDNVNHHSSSETLQNKMVQRVTIKFWDRNNLIRKVLDWNPAWFNEFGKILYSFNYNIYWRKFV